MRIPTQKPKSRLQVKYWILGGVVLLLLTLIWMKLRDMGQVTVVNSDDLTVATVEKGDLTRDVRAPGSLLPIDLNFIAAGSDGKVDVIHFEAGDKVVKGQVIMELENPQLLESFDTARFEVESLQADYNALQQRLSQQVLRQQIVVADFNARYEMAKLKKQAYESLRETGAASDINYNESALLEQQLAIQHKLEVERLDSLPELHKAEKASAQSRISKALRQLSLSQHLMDGLKIKANATGVLQEVLLEKGERVQAGTILARIAQQDKLKAQLRVQESQVKYVEKGLRVNISADGNTVKGKVSRIDPSVQQGVVLVDVLFIGEPLFGARPDLRVEGTIELEQVNDVLKIRRPAFSREFGTGSLFVINQDGTRASRRQVTFGRGSVDIIEVTSALNEGDQVIVSNTNRYEKLTEIAIR